MNDNPFNYILLNGMLKKVLHATNLLVVIKLGMKIQKVIDEYN